MLQKWVKGGINKPRKLYRFKKCSPVVKIHEPYSESLSTATRFAEAQ
jgi:hypothetical protein